MHGPTAAAAACRARVPARRQPLLPARPGAADRHAAGRGRRRRLRSARPRGIARGRRRPGRAARRRRCPTSSAADLRAAAARGRRRDRRLHRQRADRAGLRHPQRLRASTPTRSCSRSARPTWRRASLQGFPVSSSGSRTVIGDVAGQPQPALLAGRRSSPSSSTLLVAAAGARGFPVAALGALVICAAIRLVDVPEFRRIARFRRSELVLALATTVGVLVARHPVRRARRGRAVDPRPAAPGGPPARRRSSATCPGVAGMHDIDDYPDAHDRARPGGLPLRLAAVLRQRRGLPPPRAAPRSTAPATPVEWFVLNAEANVEVDITADRRPGGAARRSSSRRGIVFGMARVKQELRDDLARTALLRHVPKSRIFATLPTAVEAYQEWASFPPGVSPESVRRRRQDPSRRLRDDGIRVVGEAQREVSGLPGEGGRCGIEGAGAQPRLVPVVGLVEDEHAKPVSGGSLFHGGVLTQQLHARAVVEGRAHDRQEHPRHGPADSDLEHLDVRCCDRARCSRRGRPCPHRSRAARGQGREALRRGDPRSPPRRGVRRAAARCPRCRPATR